ncbi:YccS family putative transporter [Basilea psittacipulmonis]|uniref:YccS family putative transporter n=1 Tax=Basilea psittacipulmonis TaxID=1472345 RepID=UPI00068C925E|nr:YccS family putative transporter [Basilea psittacipulmonis]
MKHILKPLHLDNKTVQLLPVIASFILVGVITSLFHLRYEATALFLGVIAGGLGDVDHRITGRIKNLIIIILGFGLCACLVQLALPNPYYTTLLITFIAFATIMMGAIDSRYRIISFATLLVAIYVLLTYVPDQLEWYINPLMLIIGCLIYQGVNLTFQIIFPNHPVQESLAKSFYHLSAYIQIKARFFAIDEYDELNMAEYELATKTRDVTESFNATRDILFNRLAGQRLPNRRRRQLNDFFIAQDIHEHVSASHVDYREIVPELEHTDLLFRIERLLNLQARACRQYANTLIDDTEFKIFPQLERAYEGLEHSLERFIKEHPNRPRNADLIRLVTNLGDINVQIKRLGTLPAHLNDASLATSNASHFKESITRLKNNLTVKSPYFRHAVRMAVVAFIDCVIIRSFDIHLGYWILLTSVLVCQPNHKATKERLRQRVLGTAAGVLFSYLLLILQLNSTGFLLCMVLASILFFWSRTSSYSLTSFFITVQVFSGFAFIGILTPSALFSRIIDTTLGAFISLVLLIYLWPDWKFMSLKSVSKNVITSNANYLRIILKQLQEGEEDDIEYRIARRAVHENAASLASIATELQDHQKHHGNLIDITNKLVQLNYKLVSHISVLGAYRGHLHDKDKEILNDVVQSGLNLSNLLEQIPVLDTVNFNEHLNSVQLALHEQNTQNDSIMTHPLERCTELLNEYAQLIKVCQQS